MEESDNKSSPKPGADMEESSKLVADEERGSDVEGNGILCSMSSSFIKEITFFIYMYVCIFRSIAKIA